MWKFLSLVVLLALTLGQPAGDLVDAASVGMDSKLNMYSGYLNTTNSERRLHYVMILSESNSQLNDPLVMWLNGGPGCSSMLGMLHEIGPYIVGNNYTKGQQLTRNPYSWTRNANIVFLESPAGVGYSINNQRNYQHNDSTTVEDAYAALKDLLTRKFPTFRNSSFFLSGESYAGKYIPDLTAKILDNRNVFDVNLKGILVGNGVMSFENDELSKSSVQYMYEHDFVSPHLMEIYRQSCFIDYDSPRCRFFNFEFNEVRRTLNHYNVYEVCTSKTSEASRLSAYLDNGFKRPTSSVPNEIRECPSDNGIIQYLAAYPKEYHSETSEDWQPCTSIIYDIDPKGSIAQYKRIRLNKAVKIWLFNGDWDDVVPFPDTLKNLNKMNIPPVGAYNPWFVGEDHAGFYQLYDELTVITVKGAGHMVPENKREAAFQMFYNFIKGRPINTPVDT